MQTVVGCPRETLATLPHGVACNRGDAALISCRHRAIRDVAILTGSGPFDPPGFTRVNLI
jgi:hypothetical protein